MEGRCQPEPGLVGGQEEPPEGTSDLEQEGFRETLAAERGGAVRGSPWVGRSAVHGFREQGRLWWEAVESHKEAA